ncbi:sensor histidine kinase [Streptantibioticus ferralitis]|uniref:histidine kinase n=1 Tax=Streptantibioticus ferralitis TaxID=236510 RepID=A0ABT5Z4Q1_9ACTN|nr:histidine kinase [Streptantibioticus ferralitis]MDF2258556.1 histidine kinase [Streptantibioticus ferralitis]
MPTGSVAALRERPAYVWGIRAMRIAGLAALVGTTTRAHPAPGGQGRGLALTCVLVVAALAWLVWILVEGRRRWTAAALMVMAVAGGVLGGLSPHSFVIAFPAVAALAAGGSLAPEVSIAITVAAALALTATTLAVGGDTAVMLGYLVAIGAGLGAGFIRLGYVERAEVAELLLEQTRRAQQAEAQAAALRERTRIAREIHDILAHSLGALSMQLEAAHALLDGSPAHETDPAVAKALRCVERSGHLTREGLTETRRAVLALREDTALLPEMLASLVASRGGDEHEGECSPAIAVRTRGTPRRLAPEATVALYRTAQEAVTNAAKHAPGQPVTLDLAYTPEQVTLTVTNPLAAAGTERPLGASGAGYGLTGLRERAELAGGTLTARVVDNTWSVCVTIPV